MEHDDDPALFVQLPAEVQHTVLELLPLRDACNVACVNSYLRNLTLSGLFATKLWKQHSETLLGPGMVALHANSLSIDDHPATYWRQVARNALELQTVRWWRPGSQMFLRSVQQEEGAEEQQRRKKAALTAVQAVMASEGGAVASAARRDAFLHSLLPETSSHMPMKSLLARSGHSSTLLGPHVVLVGGVLRDSTPITDVLVLHLASMTITTPRIRGTPPTTRFRHTTTPVAIPPSSPLESTLISSLPPDVTPSGGTLLLLFGGYNSTGEQFGRDQLEGLWVAHDCSVVAWVKLQAQGEAPSCRYHHVAQPFNGGKSVVVYGGEGFQMNDSSEYGPCVYVLDVGSLTWTRTPTFSSVSGQCPGVRSLHLSTLRTAPDTGHTELVVVGGHCLDVLVEMVPFALDLETWRWRRSPAYPPNSEAFLPPPRQRASATAIAGRWLLVTGGQGLQDTFLEDIHKLHLPSLTWQPINRVIGAPRRQLRRVAGHSLDGLVAFGGCTPTIMGILPVLKADVLLLGKVPKRPTPKPQAHPLAAAPLPPSQPISFAPYPSTLPIHLPPASSSSSTTSSSSFAHTPSSPPLIPPAVPLHTLVQGLPGTQPPERLVQACSLPQRVAPGRGSKADDRDRRGHRPGAWRFRMREKRVREVTFTVADVQLRLYRDTATGLLYASRPDNSDYSDSSSDADVPSHPRSDPLADDPLTPHAPDTSTPPSTSSSLSSRPSPILSHLTLPPTHGSPPSHPTHPSHPSTSSLRFRASTAPLQPRPSTSTPPYPEITPCSPAPPNVPGPPAARAPLPEDPKSTDDTESVDEQLMQEYLMLKEPVPSRQAVLCFMLMFALTAAVMLCTLPFAGGGL